MANIYYQKFANYVNCLLLEKTEIFLLAAITDKAIRFFLVAIEFDMLAYKKRTNSRAVKKTLSIPEWLNEAAIAKGINFSQVLQEALLTKVQL